MRDPRRTRDIVDAAVDRANARARRDRAARYRRAQRDRHARDLGYQCGQWLGMVTVAAAVIAVLGALGALLLHLFRSI